MWDSDSGIYTPGPIKPVVKFKENISIWTIGRWEHYRVDFIEPMPRSSQMAVEMVVASGATTLAAGGTIAKRVVAALQLNEGEFLHLRWEPLDYVEGILWEQAGQARFQARNVLSRVTPGTKKYDPYLATTTFFILGRDRDMNLEVRNPMTVATPVARFIFWGYRYLLTKIPGSESEGLKRSDIDMELLKKVVGATTFLPAEGRV